MSEDVKGDWAANFVDNDLLDAFAQAVIDCAMAEHFNYNDPKAYVARANARSALLTALGIPIPRYASSATDTMLADAREES